MRFRVEGLFRGRPAASNVFEAASAEEARQRAEAAGITVSSVQPDGEPPGGGPLTDPAPASARRTGASANRKWPLALTVAVVALAVWGGLSQSRINQLERDNAQLRLYADQLHHSRTVAVEDTGTIPVSVFDKSARSPDRAAHFAKTFSIPPHVEFVDYTSHALDLQSTIFGSDYKERYKREFLKGLTAGEITTSGFRLLSFEPGTLYTDGQIRWRARGVVFPDHGVK